jgi:hypothetical protein
MQRACDGWRDVVGAAKTTSEFLESPSELSASFVAHVICRHPANHTPIA